MCSLYFYPLCQNNQPFTASVNIYRHILSVRRNGTPFNVRCSLNAAYGSIYIAFENYRSHLNRYHHDFLNDYDISVCHTLNKSEQPPSLSLSNTNIIQDKEDECIAIEENSDEDALDTFNSIRAVDNNIAWLLFTGVIIKDNIEQFTISSFDKHYTCFLLDLREGRLLSQSIIKSVTSYFKTMLNVLYKIIHYQAAQSSAGLLIPLTGIEKLILQIKISI